MKLINGILIGLVILNLLVIGNVIYTLRNGCPSYEMVTYNSSSKIGVTGFNNEKYYCVWTKGRNTKEITSTEEHEKCHLLIDRDKEHFCE